ncbi:hypothetical protein [Arthrobacter sp. AL12]|uniref:hypothetical protein n=1 Tax=Arthrobacter sp. AL12 TaxID=3042241 RepID=UPI00249A1C11|nr:hypothetical protein [Arthrobacter sp. AL12]MDI3211697.1 hypothetical protein [Arthrobacter sp. AL12]
MFTSQPDHHRRNIVQAFSYRARPAILSTPTGEQEPAVILRSGERIHGILPIAQALKLADQIADAVEAHDTSPNSPPPASTPATKEPSK